MPSEASKCSTPYTSNCVGNAKALHSQGQPASPEQRPAIIKELPSGLEYCAAAATTITVDAGYGTTIRVSGQPYLVVSSPVLVDFGALAMSLTEDQAIAFGDALIQVAHRRRAAIASAKADAQPEGGAE